MHKLHCPNCGKTLTSGRPLPKAKIRCPACQHVFIGTTQRPATPPPASSAPAAPPAGTGASDQDRHGHRAYHSTRMVKVRSKWPLVAVPIGAGLIVGLIIALVLVAQSRTRERKRMEAQRPVLARRPAPRRREPPPTETDTADTSNDSATPRTRPAVREVEPVAEGKALQPEHVEIVDTRAERGGGDNTFIVGRVRNVHASRTLDEVHLAIDALGEDGRLVDSRPVDARCVPPNGTVGFEVRLPRVPAETPLEALTFRPRIVAEPAWFGDDHVCMVIPPKRYTRDLQPGAVALTLNVRNNASAPLADLRLCVDLYRSDGRRHIGHYAISGPDDIRVPPGKTATLNATLETLMPELVGSMQVRVVARRAQ